MERSRYVPQFDSTIFATFSSHVQSVMFSEVMRQNHSNSHPRLQCDGSLCKIHSYMEVEFDTAKDAANREKHGISLAFNFPGLRCTVFDDPALQLLPAIRMEDEEERYKAVGMVEGRLYAVVHVWRGESARFISVRGSNGGEEKAYHCD